MRYILLLSTFVLFVFVKPVFAHTGSTVVISITEQGFEPSQSTLIQGDRLLFKNESNRPAWPASDVHPTHEAYAALDPKKPLLPGTEWSLVVEESGVFGLHDHLEPQLTGLITVQRDTDSHQKTLSFGQKIEQFFNRLWQRLFSRQSLKTQEQETAADLTQIEFIAPDPYEFEDLYQQMVINCGVADFNCVGQTLEQVTNTYGPAAAVRTLERLISDQLVVESIDTHQLAHRIGRETARRFGMNSRGFLLCPMNEFNGGCQHGFFELALGYSDSAVTTAQQICDSLATDKYSPKDQFYCYHGVGHGVMMAQAYDLTAAVKVCDSLPENFTKDGCLQGVFMENVNAALFGFAKEGVFEENDPLAPCNKLEERYQYQCYINHAGLLMKVSRSDLKSATTLCLQATTEHQTTCLSSIGLMVTNPVWQQTLLKQTNPDLLRGAKELCSYFPENHLDTCVKSGIDNLMNFATLEPASALRFCELYSDVVKETCLQQVGLNLRNQATGTTDLEKMCEVINDEKAQKICLGSDQL